MLQEIASGTNHETTRPTRVIRKRQVLERIGLSDTTLWRMVRDRRFPAPLQLSANAIGWREGDVEDWLATRVTTTR